VVPHFGNLKRKYKNSYFKLKMPINFKINGLGDKMTFYSVILKELTIKYVLKCLMILIFSNKIIKDLHI